VRREEPGDLRRAIAEGDRRSRDASRPGPPAPVPALRPSLVPASLAGSRVGAFLIRHRWCIIGLLLLLLAELVLFFGFGSGHRGNS
jgi:hypothetical protein